MSDENKEKYQIGDNQLIWYWILWTNIIIIVWLTVKRITNLIFELKGKDIFKKYNEVKNTWIAKFNALFFPVWVLKSQILNRTK